MPPNHTKSLEIEASIAKAIKALDNHEFTIISHADCAFKVPYLRLCACYQGHQSSRAGHNKTLSPDQEKALKLYLDCYDTLSRSAKKRYIKQAANSIL